MCKSIKDVIYAAVGMIFIISAAVIFTVAFRPLYYLDVQKMRIAETYQYDEQDIIDSYNELIDYNISLFHKELKFSTFPMSEGARIHFKEVKKIFQGFLILVIGTGIISVATLLRRIRKRDLKYLRLTGIITIFIPTVLGSMIALNWEWFFITFHEKVFQNDYWLFDPVTDPIINCLPDEFFMHCAFMIVGLIFLLSMLCILFGKTTRRGEKYEDIDK